MIAASAVRFLDHGKGPQQTVQGTQSETPGPDKLGGYRTEDIIAAHLFGRSEQRQPLQAVASKTRLHLSLAGIIASDDPRYARAIIASQGSLPKIYAVGDRLEKADATLHSIDEDMVLLERNGKLESLAMVRAQLGLGRNAAGSTVKQSVIRQPALQSSNDVLDNEDDDGENEPNLPAGLRNIDRQLQNLKE